MGHTSWQPIKETVVVENGDLFNMLEEEQMQGTNIFHGTCALCLSKGRTRTGGQEVVLRLQPWSGCGWLHHRLCSGLVRYSRRVYSAQVKLVSRR